MRSHGFFTHEGKRRWRHVRFHRWFSFGHDPDRKGEPRFGFDIGGEVARSSELRRWGFKISTRGEETLDIHLLLGFIAQTYWELSAHRRGRQLRLWPRFRIAFQIGLTGMSWCFGEETHEWSRNASWRERLRRNDLTWFRYSRKYQREERVILAQRIVIELPEGKVPATATLKEERRTLRVGPYRRTRRTKGILWTCFPLPRRFDQVTRHVWVDVDSPGLPHAGKGENSWDCGDDAIFGYGVAVDLTSGTPEQPESWGAKAAEEGRAKCMAARRRYGDPASIKNAQAG